MKKLHTELGEVVQLPTPALGRQNQADFCDFKANLVCIVLGQSGVISEKFTNLNVTGKLHT